MGAGDADRQAKAGSAGLPGVPWTAGLVGGELRRPAAQAGAGEGREIRPGRDLKLMLGSSLVVNRAASLVGLAVEPGARVVLVNRGEMPYDQDVSLRVTAGIGEILPPAVERVGRALGGDRPAAGA